MNLPPKLGVVGGLFLPKAPSGMGISSHPATFSPEPAPQATLAVRGYHTKCRRAAGAMHSTMTHGLDYNDLRLGSDDLGRIPYAGTGREPSSGVRVMNFVVTGSLGHVGRPLTQELVSRGHEVIFLHPLVPFHSHDQSTGSGGGLR